jgi:hypothetical protein
MAVNAGSRIPALREQVEHQRKTSDRAAATYVPRITGKIDDLNVYAEAILQQLPGVVRVDFQAATTKSRSRIIHLRDWHVVPRNLYAFDLRNAVSKSLSEEEIDLLHQELLLEVEAVQLEHEALLRCLAKQHGLRRVFCEGITKQELAIYQKKIAALRGMHGAKVPELGRQLDEVRGLKAAMINAGRDNTAGYQRMAAIERDIVSLMERYRLDLLELSAADRLLITDDIEEILPLDDREVLDANMPFTPDGRLRLDPTKIEARHDAQVREALGRGSFALVILGGSHDLGASVNRLTGGSCEYLRVTTRRFREATGEDDVH